jgi:type II secretory ATPase GspE/PulE/Tfp pilus assembly ATPase PilB-like protein
MNWANASYKEMTENGYTVFSPFIKTSVELLGDSDDETSHYLAVLSKKNSKDEAIILTTKKTAALIRQQLHNIEILLDNTHRFVDVKRVIADADTVRSFIKDAVDSQDEVVEGGLIDISQNFNKFRDIIALAVEMGASDIHYVVKPASARFAFRIDGTYSFSQQLKVIEAREMMSAALNNAASAITGLEDDIKIYDEKLFLKVEAKDKNGSVRQEDVTLRLSRRGFIGSSGYKAVMRVNVHSHQSKDLKALNYPPEQEKILSKVLNAPYGIFLATGPVGSGKSTTTSAMLEMFNPELGGMTVEDPIEFDIRHENIDQFQVDENNPDMTLKELLKASLRLDPDICSVAEVRDEEVAELVFRYSNVGTVMVSTVHTNEAIGAYERLNDLGIGLNALSAPDTFLGILNQRLLRRICPKCSLPHTIEGAGVVYKRNLEGCSSCKKGLLGGRITVAELLQPTLEDTPFILEKKWTSWRINLISRGFKTLALRALELSMDRKICWEEALTKIPHSDVVSQHIETREKGLNNRNTVSSDGLIEEVS